jgi:hypothetical protein
MFLTPVCVGRIDGLTNTSTYLRDFVMPFAGRVTAVKINDTTAVTASDSNYYTLTLVNKGLAGAGSTSPIGTCTTKATGTGATGNISANIPASATLHTTYANTLIVEGDVLQLTLTKTSSGAFTNGSVEIFAVPGGY